MNEHMHAYIAASQCLISTGVVVYLWYGPVARLRRDNFRGRIRALRDGLFDYMWKNGHDFESPGYRQTRAMLNGMIRCSNLFSITNFAYAAYVVFKYGTVDAVKGDDIANLPDSPLKQELLRVRKTAHRDALTFIFVKPSGVLAVSALLAVVWTGRVFAWAKKYPAMTKDALVTLSADMLINDACHAESESQKTLLAIP